MAFTESRVQHIVLKLMIFFDQELNDFFFYTDSDEK